MERESLLEGRRMPRIGLVHCPYTMKNLIKRINDIYHYGNVSLFISLLGSLAMGTIHLISAIMHFDWTVIAYCVFFYLVALTKVWQWAIAKYNIRPGHYASGIISILMLLAPMMASFVLTIHFRDATHYIFDWLIYGYALYGTVKMVFAIRRLSKKDKPSQEVVLAFLGMLSALYTIQMMEFQLIHFASDGPVDESMYLMQLFSQGAIFLFSIFVIAYFLYRALGKEPSKQE